MNSVFGSPVFICGLPRSGTSLLLGLLDGHPDLAVAPFESKFFLTMMPRITPTDPEDLRELAANTVLHIWTARRGYWKRFLSDWSPEDVSEAFQTLLPTNPSPGDCLEASILAWSKVSGQDLASLSSWIEKTPYTERYLSLIQTEWPRARFIHIIRDPRGILNTYQKRDRFRGRKITSDSAVAQAWLQSANYALRNRAQVGSEGYLILRFEDLVSRTDEALAQVSAFLSMADLPVLRLPTRAAGRMIWGGNSIERGYDSIDSTPAYQWRDELSQSSIRSMEGYCQPIMEQMGYESVLPPEKRPATVRRLAAKIWLFSRTCLSHLIHPAPGMQRAFTTKPIPIPHPRPRQPPSSTR